ncbi:hypothetical protein N0V82_009841 [Gnomoniopsis sp. IMI 355080]|nr:hypothetical protein N0V82_009841 [Gnomoniopsis sp. IMI 355080]
MQSQPTTSASKRNHRQRDASLLSGSMDRKNPSFTWPYSYPPFPSAPGWFSVNGVGYQPQFTTAGSGGGIESMGMGVPVWVQPPDLRSMPAMSNPQRQPATQAQEANSTPSHSSVNASTAAAAASPSRSSPVAVDNANSNTTIGALVASPPSSPMTVEAAMQCLSGQLHDAIRLCTDCLKTHADCMAKVHFTTAETRNGMWKDLLKHKLKSNGFLQDGFNNLGRRLAYYMEQAYCASQDDPTLNSGEQEKQREAKDRFRRLRLLRATCDEVVKLTEDVFVDVLDCKEMLGLMKDMKKKLDGETSQGHDEDVEDEQEDGEDGGNSGDTQSANAWA